MIFPVCVIFIYDSYSREDNMFPKREDYSVTIKGGK